MNERTSHIYERLREELGDAFGDAHLARVAEIASGAASEALDGYPRGAGSQADDDMVQILVFEKVARSIEREFLNPRSLELAGPMLFDQGDIPSYIIGITT